MGSLNEYDEHVYKVKGERRTRVGQLFGTSALFFTSRAMEYGLHNTASLAVANSFRYNSKEGKFIFREEYYKSLEELKNKKSNELKRLRKERDEALAKKDADSATIRNKYKVESDRVNKEDYSKDIKKLKEQLDSQWNKMTNFWDAHEVKDKRLVVKKDFNKNYRDDMNRFINRQHAINNTIQGMYSKLDKNALQQVAWGRLVMMFRKWMVPAWNRRFKKEFTNYEMGMNQEGYYLAAYKFAEQLYKDLKAGEFSIMKNWNSLNNTEKANLMRVLKDTVLLVGLYVLVGALRGIEDDDDNWALNMIAYQVNRLATELGAFHAVAMPGELFKIMNSPAAALGTIQSLQYLITSTNFLKEIERGKYEGLRVYQRNLIRTVPLAETLYSISYPEEKLKYFSSKNF
jgi:hypothetical protein